MTTVLLTISRGFLARNILLTDILPTLAADARVVIATQAHADPDFRAIFGRPNVEFVPLPSFTWRMRDRVFIGLHRNLIWNRTIRFTSKYGIYGPSRFQALRYMVQLLVFRPLAVLSPLRRFVRWCDRRFALPPEAVLAQLRDCRPDVVFSTNPMEDGDAAYLKAAERLGIPSVGLVKSWDNMSKTHFRIMPDVCLVWGPYMREEAQRYQDCPADRIFEVGVPQFDAYVRPRDSGDRRAFLQEMGLDPDRRTILFGSEGKVTPGDPHIVAALAGMIGRQELCVPVQVLVRPHFGYRGDVGKFDAVAGLPHVSVDRRNVPRSCFYDQWDFSPEHFQRLVRTLGAADVMVTTASTLAIDAAAWDIPTVSIAYDPQGELPRSRSVARWYETEYYSHVLATGAVLVVRNPMELRAALVAALAAPRRRRAQREELVRRFAGRLDGRAGKRVGRIVLAVARKERNIAPYATDDTTDG